MHTDFQTGISAARAAYARITRRGQKWKNRRIPVFIRQQLLVPYFVTEEGSEWCLYAIQEPDLPDGKVHFTCVARLPADAQSAPLPAGQRPIIPI